MKKLLLALLGLIVSLPVYAFDFNVDATTDMLYTSYIKNEAYNAMASATSITAVDAFEKLRLKAKQEIEAVKFNFDGRIYLYPDKSSIDYYIDNAYFSVENGPLVLYAGKQRIKWGTGYFWNPTDKLQTAKNVFRTEEDLEGIYAMRLEFSNDIITPSLILVPNIQTGDSTFKTAIQLYKLIGTADFFVNYISDGWWSSGGGAVSWDADLVVINLEFGYEMIEDIDTLKYKKYSLVAGVSKRLSEDTSFFVEYYRNEINNTNVDYDLMLQNGIFPRSFSKVNYFAYNLQYTWDKRIGFSITGIHGLDDGTSYIFPSISYVENPNWDIQLSLLENLTQNHMSEGYYATPIYNTVELRINAYF